MKYHRYIFLFVMSFLSITSCQNEGFYYNDDARIRLEGPYNWTLGSDSLMFSFITFPVDSIVKQMDIEVCVIGNTADYARIATVDVIADKTTAPKELYELPREVVIQAGDNKAVLPVLLRRDLLLQEQSVRLFISVAESDDFKVGNNEQNQITIIWNDVLSRPTNWSDLQEFFGAFSLAKYRFMLNYSGITEFDTDKMSWAELQNYKIKLTTALYAYSKENPENPLTDENGILVDFEN